jgi:hypothetical protein
MFTYEHTLCLRIYLAALAYCSRIPWKVWSSKGTDQWSQLLHVQSYSISLSRITKCLMAICMTWITVCFHVGVTFLVQRRLASFIWFLNGNGQWLIFSLIPFLIRKTHTHIRAPCFLCISAFQIPSQLIDLHAIWGHLSTVSRNLPTLSNNNVANIRTC